MFQVPQQGGSVLDFVDDQRFGKSVQQLFRRVFSGLGVDWQVQAEIGGRDTSAAKSMFFRPVGRR
jgi:hypothetical protein